MRIISLVLLVGCVSSSRSRFDDLVRVPELDVARLDPEEAAQHPEIPRMLATPLTADAAVRVAILNSPALQSRLAMLDVALADFRGAGRVRNPDLELEAEYGEARPDLAFELLVDIADIARAGIRRRAADASLEAARVEAAMAVLDHAYDTRVAFYEHQADLERLELYRVTVDAFLAAAEAAAEMRTAGNVADLDVVQQRALYEESRIALVQAELAAQQSRETLHVLMGLSGESTTWTVEERLPVPTEEPVDLERLEALAFERSLVLAQKRHQLEALARRVGLARTAGAIPALRFGVAGAREEGSWAFGPRVEVEIPVFDQGQGPIGRAAAELLIGQHDYVDSAVRVRSAARRAFNRHRTARARAVFVDDTFVPAREAVLRETLLQYNAMNVGIFQLLDAKRALVDAQQQGVRARLEYWQALAEVELGLAGRTRSMGGGVEVPEMAGDASGGGH